ncbi:hypothetical protein BGY98DRAFT_326972 [Russula aff. rugulosa BPL654]|nr:hypothetical protein BGY98DRAFT_326972 [Russula aff. rugulosa BPL654]
MSVVQKSSKFNILSRDVWLPWETRLKLPSRMARAGHTALRKPIYQPCSCSVSVRHSHLCNYRRHTIHVSLHIVIAQIPALRNLVPKSPRAPHHVGVPRLDRVSVCHLNPRHPSSATHFGSHITVG